MSSSKGRFIFPFFVVLLAQASLLLCPSAWGQWASLGAFTAENNKVAGASWSGIAIDTSAAVDNVIVLVLATDNLTTTDGQTNNHTSITDTKGNTWTKRSEFTNGQGAAAAGATVSIWTTKVTTALTAGTDTLTANFSGSITAKAIHSQRFSVGAGNVVSLDAGPSDLANDAADAGSITLSGATAKEHLWIRAQSVELSSASYTASTNYAVFGGVLSGASTSGGAGASNIHARGEFRILNATSDSTDPTTIAADQAGTYIALNEAAPPAGGCANFIATLGAGCK